MACGVEQLDQRTLSDSDVSPNQTAETEAKQLSFADVMRLVQEGKEVPGATKLDIKATNESPTPSQMQRRLKPWEISSLGGGLGEDPGLGGGTISPTWPGNASGSPSQSWLMWLGKGKFGVRCCPRRPDPR
uniref:Peroxisomal membrane protein PEX14-like KPWE domain-containing protein n=1 Tax=Sander lucioperca TaxID=283035 RepID=A0A8C9ZAQ6_SANLU